MPLAQTVSGNVPLKLPLSFIIPNFKLEIFLSPDFLQTKGVTVFYSRHFEGMYLHISKYTKSLDILNQSSFAYIMCPRRYPGDILDLEKF